MGETTKSYRIKANVGSDSFISVNLEQEYDAFDILSLKIKSEDVYRLHNSNYGVIVGRVLANNGFGIPNAKISIFIESDRLDGGELKALYPFTSPAGRDENGVRYNLLPDEKVGDCHQVVGTFPNKRYVLDNDDIVEMFDKYYKYTTRTNNSGDYMICGVPTGNQTLHMDLDLSDCGILSQRPRDFVYKGYTIEQFENPNMFKTGTSYSNLSQVFSQDQSVYVQPFWGNESLGEKIGITRADIDVAFKFEPTCVFMGCVASDNSSQGISKKCIPTPHMGDMDELVSGEGTIEMIRKTYAGSVEEFQVKGTELINADGIWCYQIPMNLDYMITDEYGNMVPTDNPEKGIPTRARVRFRVSMQDMEENVENYFRPKVLVPHNPQNLQGVDHEEYDYEFGTFTKEESFRDLFWNNVYTVKSYIPRFQKRKVAGWNEDKFTGIKHVQNFGKNNPMPYNNIRIKLPFMFKVMCILIKIFIKIVSLVNTIIAFIGSALVAISNFFAELEVADIQTVWRVFSIVIPIVAVALNLPGGVLWTILPFTTWNMIPTETKLYKKIYSFASKLRLNVIENGLCPDLENWYFAPVEGDDVISFIDEKSSARKKGGIFEGYNLLKQTLNSINNKDDATSIDDQNQDADEEAKCLTTKTDYLISCIEMNLAQEYKVINFDFYNDWINGMIYIPRFMRIVKKKKKYSNGKTIVREKVRGCMDNTKIFSKTRRYTQMCSIGYKRQSVMENAAVELYSKAEANLKNDVQVIKSNNMHKKRGFTQEKIFGKNGGICHEKETLYGQFVYYLKPCEWTLSTYPQKKKINLFATDLVLLGSLNDCDMFGVPQAFKHLRSSSYIMPTNLAITNMEENGPLYAYGDKGTICSKNNQTTEISTSSDLNNGVKVVGEDIDTGNAPLSSELYFFSGASDNYDVEFNDLSDTMAVTEAAGIAWNYTGPGQGKIDKKKMYYPGGHFLGLSCVNSQTNIKSCINLERICELGTIMSQRKEDVKGIEVKSGVTSLRYMYSIPTGFISGDDIIDDDFRIMFATMNKNRLIATKTDMRTGYKTYDFLHSTPVNFSGEFSKFAGYGTLYNRKVEVRDESSLLTKFKIAIGLKRDDYDAEESGNTIAKTSEFPSVDYYTFRLGLDYDDLSYGNLKHIRQFAKDEGGMKYLPQYENSFYFYFGIRDGGTALDEFNKQFFSECETESLIDRGPQAYVIIDEFYLCNGTSYVTPFVNNLDGVLTFKLEWGEHTRIPSGHDFEGFSVQPTEETRKFGANFIWGRWNNAEEIGPFNLPYGEYTLTITDENGDEAFTSFTVGKGIANGNFASYDFNIEITPIPGGRYYLARDENNRDEFNGGYIVGTDITLSGEVITNGRICPKYEGENISTDESADINNGACTLYLKYANEPVDIYLLVEKPSCSKFFIYLTTTTLQSPNVFNLYMGPVLKINYKVLREWAMKKDWWKWYNNKTTDSELQWNIRKSIVKETSTDEIFSSNVSSDNAAKMLFGMAQNSRGIHNDGKLYCSELEDNIPNGYSVDDDATYYPFYGCSTNNGRNKPYNAISYNGTMVMGNYSAKATTSGLTKSITLVGSGTGLRDGEGCIFKPIPDGDIIPAIYHKNGDSHHITLQVEDDEDRKKEAEGYSKGVVYPTITYPVVDKKFKVFANFFVLNKKYLSLSSGGGADDNNPAWAEVKLATIGGKCEAEVINGLTYDKYYGGNSYMSICEDLTGNGTSMLKRSDANVGDLDDIEESNHTDRITYISGRTEEEIGTLSFSIEEGAPLFKNEDTFKAYYETEGDVEQSKYEYIAEYRDFKPSYTFYDSASYTITKDRRTIHFSFLGDTDEDILYYFVRYRKLEDFRILHEGEGQDATYISKIYDEGITHKGIFVLGAYTKKVGKEYEGKDVVVQIWDPSGDWVDYVHVAAKFPDGNGNYVWETKKLDDFLNFSIGINNNIETLIRQTTSKFDERISFPKNILIGDFGKNSYTKDNKSWTKKIDNILTSSDAKRIPLNMWFSGLTFDLSPNLGKEDWPVVIGHKRVTSQDGLSAMNIYMIYPNPSFGGTYGGVEEEE